MSGAAALLFALYHLVVFLSLPPISMGGACPSVVFFFLQVVWLGPEPPVITPPRLWWGHDSGGHSSRCRRGLSF